MHTIGQRPVSRRVALKTLVTASVAITLFTLAGQAFSRGPSQPYTVTARTSMRSGPGIAFPTITVIWPGTTIAVTGHERDGFTSVHYDNVDGWISSSLIAGIGSPDGDTVMVGEAHVTSNVNLHSGPGDGFGVLREVFHGAALNVSNTAQNGFRYVVHEGLAGWLDESAIAWRSISGLTPGTILVTTGDLNLRDEPTLSSTPLMVMPPASTVHVLDGESNGYRRVTFDGTIGWASLAYLREPGE